MEKYFNDTWDTDLVEAFNAAIEAKPEYCLENQFNIAAEEHDSEDEYMDVETSDEEIENTDVEDVEDEADENSYIARAARGLHDAQEFEMVYLDIYEASPELGIRVDEILDERSEE
jgi:hypothetical protein